MSPKKAETQGSYVPYGQKHAHLWLNEEQQIAEVQKLKKEWAYPKLISFEVWAQALCYNDQEEDGGDAFQALMHYILADAPKRGWSDIQGVKHYDLKEGHVGEHWVDRSNPSDRYLAQQMQTVVRQGKEQLDKIAYTNPDYKQTNVNGLKAGRNQDPRYPGFTMNEHKPVDGDKKRTLKDHVIQPSNRPNGTCHFYDTIGVGLSLTVRKGQCDRENIAAFSLSQRKEGTARQSSTGADGCVSLGNRLAAVYGLYFYEGCRLPQNNWIVKTTVDGKVYHVRMRLPNPRYRRVNNHLRVIELENEYYSKRQLDTMGDVNDGQTWNDKQGFEFPPMNTDRNLLQPMLLTYDYVGWKKGDKNDVFRSRIAPWAGSVEGDNDTLFYYTAAGESDEVYNHDRTHDFLAEYGFGGRFFKRDDYGRAQTGGRAFGWTPPSALYLYPHMPDATHEVLETRPATLKLAGYMKWPEWRTAQSRNQMRRWPGTVPLMNYLEAPPVPADRQKAALGLPMRRQGDSETPTYTGPPPLTSAVVEADDASSDSEREEQPAQEVDPPTDYREQDDIEDELAPDEENDAANEANNEMFNGAQRSTEVTVDLEADIGERAYRLDEAGKIDELDRIAASETPNDEVDKIANRIAETDKIEPGAERRKKDKNGNEHFFSLSYSPWPPAHVYTKPLHEFEYEQMDQAEVDRYAQQYGEVSNLILRHSTPHRITGVKQTFGEVVQIRGKSILGMRLDSYRRRDLSAETREMFRQNMRRILSIYWDNSGELGQGSKRISVDNKRQGMLNGIYGDKCKTKADCPVNYKKDGEQLLPPVFVKGKEHYKGKRADHEKRATVEGSNKEQRTLRRKQDPDPQLNVDAVESAMTVLQWLQTPWHYEYLPYQPMTSLFKDGESFCAGCTRCARPYYEYQFKYSWYLKSLDRTRHWEFMYWRRGTESEWDFRKAPEPFHEPDFWFEPTVRAKGLVQAEPDEQLAEELGDELESNPGYHNWPTKLFKLGWLNETTPLGEYRGEKWQIIPGQKNPLINAWSLRAQKRGVQWLVTEQRDKVPWTFRQYINHLWDPAREQEYEQFKLVQGCVRNGQALIAYGMRDYKLQRSVKYGNVCRDCAATLDLAPGMYLRSGRVTSQVELAQSGQARDRGVDTWWLGLKDRVLPNGQKFDPWFIYVHTSKDLKLHHYGSGSRLAPSGAPKSRPQVIRTLGLSADRAKVLDQLKTREKQFQDIFGKTWKEDAEMHYEVMSKYGDERDCNMTDANGNPITKVVSSEVYVQKKWAEDSTNWSKLDAEQVRLATKTLENLWKWLDSVYYGGSNATFTLKPADVMPENRALRDSIYETHYELVRKTAAAPDPATAIKKFDPDMLREEWRNWQHGEYDNCLRVMTLQKPNLVSGRKEQQKGSRMVVPEEAYKEVIYQCTREGPTGSQRGPTIERVKDEWKQIEGTTDWNGDGYVMQFDGTRWRKHRESVEGSTPPRAMKQIRKLTQSRVFITYSLHRRVRSEQVARYVMEKMGNAVRSLFGDKHLCEILLFGMKLEDAADDTISAKRYTYIKKARKATTVFYGSAEGNSYAFDTYQTHVESVTVDAGIEIGPTYHMPHFHALVTINHWSYVTVDTMRMKAILEQMLKGTGRFASEADQKSYMLLDGDGLPFYTDNENPYVDIRLYPSDNWAEVISAYVRKSAVPGIFEAQRARTGN